MDDIRALQWVEVVNAMVFHGPMAARSKERMKKVVVGIAQQEKLELEDAMERTLATIALSPFYT